MGSRGAPRRRRLLPHRQSVRPALQPRGWVATSGVGGQWRSVRRSHRVRAFSGEQLAPGNSAARSHRRRGRGLLTRWRSDRSCGDGPFTRPVLAVPSRARGLANHHSSARFSGCTCWSRGAGPPSNEALGQVASRIVKALELILLK
jgi:hypothetical protein